MPYRLEYAKLGTSKCKGAKPCNGTKIDKGGLRFGSQMTINGNTSFAWRHFGCITKKIWENLREKDDINDAEEVDGFEDLTEEDQEKFRKAFDAKQVADEDIPDSARKPEGDDEEDGAEKPKKKATPKKAAPKKTKAKKEESGSEEEEEAVETDADSKPKKKKSAPKKRKAKDEDDESDNSAPPPPRKPSSRGGAKKSFKEESGSEDEEEEEKKPKKKVKKSKATVDSDDE